MYYKRRIKTDNLGAVYELIIIFHNYISKKISIYSKLLYPMNNFIDFNLVNLFLLRVMNY
jgi:hypothetical protein